MSTVAASPIAAARGGSFLIEPRTPQEVFTPEDLSPEQRQIAATAAQFAREEILPHVDAVEAKEAGVMRGLLEKAAGLGFTSVEIPEEYGGMGMDKITSTVVTDNLAVLASFSTAFGAHPPPGLVRHRRAEEKVPAPAGQRRMVRGLRAF
jgi:butyryl-CoA dehydrogenase